MKRIIVIVAAAVSLTAGSFAGGTWWAHRSGAAHASAHAATVYTCPMHPDYRSDHPGDCPMCGMWATGTGSDVWKRIAAPMAGGIFTSFVLELVVYPAIYEIWKWHFELKRTPAEPQSAPLAALPSLEGAP